MTWKREYIFLKYHWNLNISEILQGVLHVNDILELLLKYHFHMFMASIEIQYFMNKIKTVWNIIWWD